MLAEFVGGDRPNPTVLSSWSIGSQYGSAQDVAFGRDASLEENLRYESMVKNSYD